MISLMAVNLFDGLLVAMDWLFALDIGNLIGILVVLVVTILSMISQYINKQKEAQKRAERLARQKRLDELSEQNAATKDRNEQERRFPEPQRQLGRLPEQRPQPAAAPVDENVAAEIREFLERAATGRPAGQGPGAPKPVPPVVAASRTSAEEIHRPLSEQPTLHPSIGQRSTPTSHPMAAGPVEAKVVPTQPLTNQDRRQADAARAKNQAEAKRRQAAAARATSTARFENGPGESGTSRRKLGTLEQQVVQSKAGPPDFLTTEAMADDIATMLADTNNIRQAIVINEILTRPVHRWG